MAHYPRQLSYGANNPVIALSETEVGKLFTADTRSDIGSEAEKMRAANGINELVVQFIRLERNEALQSNMLVMERVYAIDFRSFEVEMREIWFDVFADQLADLHRNGFAHCDLSRPPGTPGERYDNILLTREGIRLIDVGISVLRASVGNTLFDAYVRQELTELAEFRTYFLGR
jgi:serine/threonine protein kinase